MSSQKDADLHTKKGQAFANAVCRFFQDKGIELKAEPTLEIGFKGKAQKEHAFDFSGKNILIECKANKWRNGNEVPSGKLQECTAAMLYFYLKTSSWSIMMSKPKAAPSIPTIKICKSTKKTKNSLFKRGERRFSKIFSEKFSLVQFFCR